MHGQRTPRPLAERALSFALAALGAIPGEVVAAAIEAVHALALVLALPFPRIWAISGDVVASAVPAAQRPLALSLAILALSFRAIWAVAREVIATAVEAIDGSPHFGIRRGVCVAEAGGS